MRPGILALRAGADVHDRQAHEGVAADAKPRAHVDAGIGWHSNCVRDDTNRQIERGAKRRGAKFRRRPHFVNEAFGESPTLGESRGFPNPAADAIGRRDVARPQQATYRPIRIGLAKEIYVLDRHMEIERLGSEALNIAADVDGRHGRMSRPQGRQIVGRRATEPVRAGKFAEGDRRPRGRPGGGILGEGLGSLNVLPSPAPPANGQAGAIPDVLQRPAPQRPARHP